jgi:hypothetical protein
MTQAHVSSARQVPPGSGSSEVEFEALSTTRAFYQALLEANQ